MSSIKRCAVIGAGVIGAGWTARFLLNGLDVSVHPASTLFKQGTEVPAMQRGNLEMSTMTTFEVAQQVPELGYFDRAYLMRDYDHLRRVFDGPIGADFAKTVAQKMGIVILATPYLGTRQVSLRQKRSGFGVSQGA